MKVLGSAYGKGFLCSPEFPSRSWSLVTTANETSTLGCKAGEREGTELSSKLVFRGVKHQEGVLQSIKEGPSVTM